MLTIIALSLLVRFWSERQIQYAKNPEMSSPTLIPQATQRASTAEPSLSPSMPSQAPPQPIFQQPSIAGQGEPLASDQLTKEVQRLLLDLGFNPGAIDGKFGPRTKRALDEAQRSLFLPSTGAVSIEVRDQLRRALSSRRQPEYSTAPPAVVVSRSGTTSSNAVSRAQIELRKQGFYVGEVTGTLDGNTRHAILRFQASRHIIPSSGYDDGDLDFNTRRALRVE